MIQVLICDDHEIIREGIKVVFEDCPDLKVVADFGNGADAVRLLREGEVRVDIIVLDIAMQGRDGLMVLKQVKEEFPHLPILILSNYPDSQYALYCIKRGAAGYLNKIVDPDTLISAIRTIAKGGFYITPSVAGYLAGAIRSGNNAQKNQSSSIEQLSSREYQVFLLLSKGFTVREIADQLSLSPNTVSTYRTRILNKIGVRNEVELALYAMRTDSLEDRALPV